MARSPRLLVGLALGLVAYSTLQLVAFTMAPAPGARSRPLRSAVARQAGATVAPEYMVSDQMIEEFYQKTISGNGGLPPKGILMDLIIKHFLGTFDAKTKSFTRTSSYKGPPPQLPGKKDLPPAMELLKEQMKNPAFVNKGGPALDELEKVEDDGKGWVWLAADMTPGGLAISLYNAVPYGKRPLLIAKRSDVDGMFDKVNWDVALERVEVTMGGPHIKQR
jgi:hypothetical protein